MKMRTSEKKALSLRCFVAALFSLLLVLPVFSQDKPARKTVRRVPSDIAKQVKDKSPDEIAEMLRSLGGRPVPEATVDEVVEFKQKKGNALVGLSDALLNAEPEEELEELAYKMKIDGLGLLMQLKPDDVSRITALKRELEKEDKFPKIVAECDAYIYIQKMRKSLLGRRTSEKDFHRIAEELKPLVRDNPESPYVSAAGLLLAAAAAFEGNRDLEGFSDKFRDDFVRTFRESGNEKLIDIARQIDLDAQQAVVPGKRIEVSGMTVDGKRFDSKSLRGKVVLIDFWATWCGPCRAEIPNMKEMYKKYHERGFEIVGISADDSHTALANFLKTEMIPWISISDKASVEAGMPSMRERFGIRGYPTMYLLDRQGRVISTGARGGELKRLLEQEFK